MILSIIFHKTFPSPLPFPALIYIRQSVFVYESLIIV